MARDIAEYERSLIGAILLQPGKAADAVAAGVAPDWFTDDAASLMWSAIANFWKAGTIDGITPLVVKAEAERIGANPKDHRDAARLDLATFERAIEDAPFGPIDVTLDILRSAATERAAKKAVAECFQWLPQYHDAADVVAMLRERLDKILGGVFQHKKIPPKRDFYFFLPDSMSSFSNSTGCFM